METPETAVPETTPGNEPAVEQGKHEKKAKAPKKAKASEPQGEREYKTILIDTGDPAEFKRLVLPKSEEDPHWDHRMTMEVPESLIESMVDRQLPQPVTAEEGPDGTLLIDDGRTRVRAIPEVNRRRKKAGKPAFVLTVSVGKARADTIESARDVVEAAVLANIRMDDPPTVLAMKISRSLAADVPEEWLCRKLDFTAAKLHEYLALLDLPKAIQKHVDDGTIGIKAALALTKLDESAVEAAAEKLAAAAKVGKKVASSEIVKQNPDDKLATKKEIRQFVLNLQSDPFAGKHGEAVVKGMILMAEVCLGFRSIKQATAAGARAARGEDVKFDFKQFHLDGKAPAKKEKDE